MVFTQAPFVPVQLPGAVPEKSHVPFTTGLYPFAAEGSAGDPGMVRSHLEPQLLQPFGHCARSVIEPELSSRNTMLDGALGPEMAAELKNSSSPFTGCAMPAANDRVMLLAFRLSPVASAVQQSAAPWRR